MFDEAAAKKTEADSLVSQGFLSSSPVFRSFQSISSMQHSINSLQRALMLYREVDVRKAFGLLSNGASLPESWEQHTDE